MEKDRIKQLVMEMTLEEKAGMCSGADFWHTKGIGRLGIPQTMVSDGPHGLRKQSGEADHLGVNDSIEAVCFPAACATAASFDRDLLTKMGKAIGNECQVENVSVILGPAVNIKRSPLCGRNFEYYSEDPLVTSDLSGAFIKGVQRQHVGTSIKHFLANNQERRRMTSSSEVDERTLREIYLSAFEGAIVQAKPWTVMCSYNLINGIYAAENKKYLTDVLRDEWGFEGYVMSDWGAVSHRVSSLEAGLDLEMPSGGGETDAEIVTAITNGELLESVLDTACERILNIIFQFEESRDYKAIWDKEADHQLSAEIAQECSVLLKNEANILPLNENQKIAFIGKYAAEPRFQGGGSSHIHSFKVSSALTAVAGNENISYSQGYLDNTDTIDQILRDEAVNAAKNAEVAVIFAGLPDVFESEGYDRQHMKMPICQNDLIEAVAAVQPNTIVVLHNGSPVEMPWVHQVKGILEVYLGGQAVGIATTNILFGKVNPCGKLPETFPIKMEDNPSYPFYGGEGDCVEYREGVFVGYRYYETKKMDVLFPFGHGLSYTQFEYNNLKASQESLTDQERLIVSVDITNSGSVFGKEVVQVYVCPKSSEVIRPVKELKGFEKIALEPGETKTIEFELNKRAFSYWCVANKDWKVTTGDYDIQIGKSIRDIQATTTVHIISTNVIKKVYTRHSRIGELMEDPKAQEIVGSFMSKFIPQSDETGSSHGAISPEMIAAMMADMPLRALLSFIPDLKKEALQQLIDLINS